MTKIYWQWAFGVLLTVNIALALATGCSGPQMVGNMLTSAAVTVHHDAQRKVTCWLYTPSGSSAGISCLPDAQIGGE